MKMNVIAMADAMADATAVAMVVMRRKRLPPPMPLRKDKNTRGPVIMI
jgi:hypothetical protein